MSDIHVEQLDAVIKAYRNKKRLMRHGDVVNEELFEMGLGFYKYPDGDGRKLEKVESFEKLAALKSEHNAGLVRLQKHQVQAFAAYLDMQEKPLYKKGFDALEDIKSEKDLGRVTIEMEAAMAVAAQFQVSWDNGVTAEAKLETGVTMELNGKYGKLSIGAKVALTAKAKLESTSIGIELGASAEATADATLKSEPISIGNTTYSAAFYTQFKAYAKAEARLDASVGLSATTFIESDAKGKLFAGVGVSAEVGVELNGIYAAKGNSNKRLLAKANLNLSLEAGALLSLGAEFGSEGTEDVDGATFFKKSFSVEIGAIAGANFGVNILVLEEITNDIKEEIQKQVKGLILGLVGEELINYLEAKYEVIKKKADNTINYIGHNIYNQFNSNSYQGLYYTMDSSIRRLEKHIGRIKETPNSEKRVAKAERRLGLVQEGLIKYRSRIEGIREDCGSTMSEVAELLADGDMNDKTFFTRSSKILNEVEDVKDKVATMLSAIEGVTAVNLDMIELENMLDDHLIEENLATSKDPELLANRAKMNDLLQSQTYMNDSLDYITEVLTEKLVEEVEKRKKQS